MKTISSIVPTDIVDEQRIAAYEAGMNHLMTLCGARVELFFLDCNHSPEEWKECQKNDCLRYETLATIALFKKFERRAEVLIRDSFGAGYSGTSRLVNAAKVAVTILIGEINSSSVKNYAITVVERDGTPCVQDGELFYPLHPLESGEVWDITDSPLGYELGVVREIVRKDEVGYYRLVAECDLWSEPCELIGCECWHPMSAKSIDSDFMCRSCVEGSNDL